MRVLHWLKNLMIGQALRRKVNSFSRDLSKLRDEQRRCARDLTTRRKELDLIKNALMETETRLRETVDEALRIQKKYETQLEANQDKIRVLEELTVPALMESNVTLLETFRAQTAAQVGRRALIQGKSTEEE